MNYTQTERACYRELEDSYYGPEDCEEAEEETCSCCGEEVDDETWEVTAPFCEDCKREMQEQDK